MDTLTRKSEKRKPLSISEATNFKGNLSAETFHGNGTEAVETRQGQDTIQYTSPMHRAAREYADRGFPVFPCKPMTKEPATEHGFKDATTDLGQIDRWWKAKPDYNIGLTGGYVLDVDVKNGVNGYVALQEMETLHGALPDTPKSFTPTGGMHFLFRHVNGAKNTTGKIAPGLDTRGEGGYIVVAPSRIEAGEYVWLDDLDTPLAVAPDWVITKPTERVIERRVTPGANRTTAHTAQYGQAALDGEIAKVRTAQNGTRNHTLNIAALKLGQLVAGGVLDQATVESELESAALDVGLTETETRKTIASGMAAGIKQPRTVPPTGQTRNMQHAAPSANGHADGGNPPPSPPKIVIQDTADDDQILITANYTDAGNSECFAHLFGNEYRYVRQWKDWLRWNGVVWERGAESKAKRSTIETARARYRAGEQIVNPAERAQHAKWCAQSENTVRVNLSLESAKSLPSLDMSPGALDKNRHLLNSKNGYTINLRTGETYSSDPHDYITQMAGADYGPGATCPTWLKFLDEVFAGDQEMVDYFQRVAGYCATGEIAEHVFFMLSGGGRNGKNTAIERLEHVLGDYVTQTKFSTFDADGQSSEKNYALAGLVNARMTFVTEVNEEKKLDAEVIKSITGDAGITARRPYEMPFTYDRKVKVCLAVNHQPIITDMTDGMWARPHVIPFNISFLGREDTDLPRRLDEEASGILNWIIEGAVKWYLSGLGMPRAVKQAVEDYRAKCDAVGLWLSQRTTNGDRMAMESSTGYKNYVDWCHCTQRHPMNHENWGRRMTERVQRGDFTKGNHPTTRRVAYLGVGLLEHPEI